jgi:diguanylate cyclase (GGDEF)-like protein
VHDGPSTAQMPEELTAQRGELYMPRTLDEFRDWVRRNLKLDLQGESQLFEIVEQVLARQRQMVEESKHEAIQALTEGFTAKLTRLQTQLTEKDMTVSNVARYFEEVVADLTDKAHRDPKTRLLNFNWFMERVQSYLTVEQRVRWCGVGVVDITGFKRYNDTFGHAVGDLIIERVARILSDQIRSDDFLAVERAAEASDLHARFGGDEFCFLIPQLPGCVQALEIAERFRQAVEAHDWGTEDARLADNPVGVDVGVVCLRMGPIAERRGVARQLASELIQRADTLMYEAKTRQSGRVHSTAVAVENGVLVELNGASERQQIRI